MRFVTFEYCIFSPSVNHIKQCFRTKVKIFLCISCVFVIFVQFSFP